jgi:predicted XRE-type DNA-binding protein
MEARTFESVFDALADTPAQAANMKVHVELLACSGRGLVPGECLERRLPGDSGSRPRLNDLLRGKLGKFSLDALANLSSAGGLELEINLRKIA